MSERIYRACVGALIVNKKREFLLTELQIAKAGELDFVKGGMKKTETEEAAVNREIKEELGGNVDYKVLEKSMWHVVYEWPKEMQKKRGYYGQARVSFWVLFEDGDIEISERELRSYEWIPESDLKKRMIDGGWPEYYPETLLLEWAKISEKHSKLFRR